MNPGAITLPLTSITRVAVTSISGIAGAIFAIASPRIATSPMNQGLPVPSTMRPFLSTRS